jgi:hypothetical protein
MWNTLAVVAALGAVPAADGAGMTLSNVRLTYGVHGPTRSSSMVLPGDNLSIAFDIEGISVDPNGKVQYSIAMDFSDKQGKCIFKQEPQPLEAINSLGGSRLPAVAHIDVGLEQPPGEYTVRVIVNDRVKNQPQSFTRSFQVLPRGFGLVRVTTTGDSQGQNPVAVPGAGESLWVNFGVVGFERGSETKNPHVAFEMQIYDDKDRPTTAKPFVGVIDDKSKVAGNVAFLPGQFLISLNRPGKFRVEIKAVCRVSMKTSTVSFPLTVASFGNK